MPIPSSFSAPTLQALDTSPSDERVNGRIDAVMDALSRLSVVVSGLREKLERLEHATNEQQEQGKVQPEEKECVPAEVIASRSSRAEDALATANVAFMHDECEWEESIWDAMTLIGIYPLNRGMVLWLICIFALNLYLQAQFILIVFFAMTGENFDDDVLDGLRTWRVNTGHDIKYLDFAAVSLTTRLCAGASGLELSGQQASLLDSMKDYSPHDTVANILPIPIGMLMAVCAMITWSLQASLETTRIYRKFRAVSYLSRASATSMSVSDGKFQLNHISSQRFLLCVVLDFFRLAVAICLLHAGLIYLARTLGLGDLLLNALALDMVLSLDELLFGALMPYWARNLIQSLEPMQSPCRHCWTWDIPQIASLVISGAFFTLALPVYLVPESDGLTEAFKILCGGATDFVFTQSNYKPSIWFGPAPAPSSYDLPDVPSGDKYWNDWIDDAGWSESQKYVISMIAGDQGLQQHYVLQSLSGAQYSLQTFRQLSVAQASTRQNLMCGDILDNNVEFQRDIESTFSFLSRPTSCSKLSVYCNAEQTLGAITRSVCAVTCGCDTPSSTQVFTYQVPEAGCPGNCWRTPAYRAAVATKSCTNIPKTDPAMVDFVANLRRAGTTWPVLQKAAANAYADELQKDGCDAISKIQQGLGATAQPIPGHNFCAVGSYNDFQLRKLHYHCPLSCNCSKLGGLFSDCPWLCFPNATKIAELWDELLL